MNTLLSLFDGSGGFPLAATLCGIQPVAASEVEPYPIAVTRSRFTDMVHLGSVTEVNGAEIEPMDIVTFGSPCQDLSVAGKRAGLKHEENGDDETTRSGLFMEAIRIIKEMRRATNGEYPRFAVWENVPGAFSSNKGEDFRTVLDEFIKVVEPDAVMPAVPKNGWAYADSYIGNGWSIAYRVFDAQFWGVPQRRRRIYLVADFRGERAREVLFEREGLRGYFETGRTPWESTSGHAEGSSGADDREGAYGFPLGFRPENTRVYKETSTTLCNGTRPGFTTGVCYSIEHHPQDSRVKIAGDIHQTLSGNMNHDPSNGGLVLECYSIENHPADSRVNIDESGKCQTLTSRMGTGGGNVPMVMEVAVRKYEVEPQTKGYAMQAIGEYTDKDVASSLKQRDYKDATDLVVENRPTTVAVRYIVRRLTPTECARLQGFPDTWGHPDKKETLTDEEYAFWLDVRNIHAAINGKQTKDYTKEQMLTWYNKLHTDSAEYKMWGNGIALPCALYVMQGIAEVLEEEELPEYLR